MLRHYFTVALRQVLRHKAFSAINVIGLAMGMTCCMTIFLWVIDEQAVDNFHAKGDQLYNIYMTVHARSGNQGSYNTPRNYRDNKTYLVVDDAKTSIPEIKGMAFYATGYSLPWGHPETFQVGDKKHKLEGSRASADFFTMFSFPILAGDANTALKDLSSIALSRKMAVLFFGSPENAIGKSIRYENKIDFQVTAVFEDLTPHTSWKFDFLVNWESHMTRMDWASGIMQTTLLLSEGANVEDVTHKLNVFVKSRLDKDQPFSVTLGLQPFRDQYLKANFTDGKPSGGRIEYVRIFSGVAVFILIIACINFMNLATARSVKRAKEVGVRKVIGSPRHYLIGQFFGESLLLSFLALAVSLVLLQFLLPLFNQVTGKHIVAPITDGFTWLGLVGLAFVTGIMAGSYPALFLSSLKPVNVLKGVVQFTQNAIWFRKGLAVFQFGLSILLLIATIVVSQQTSFLQHMNLGYDKENLFYFPIEGELAKYDKFQALKQKAAQLPGVMMVDRSSEAPHAMGFVVDEDDGVAETQNPDDTAIKWEGRDKGSMVGFKPTSVGFDFVKLMNLDIVEGRDFSRANATDSADAFLVNEQAVKEMGLKDPIGKWVSAWQKKGHIIGVLKDYNTNSLRERIRPLIVDVKEYEYFGVILVRTEAGKTREALAGLEKIYKEINPNYPFDFRFVDEEYNKMYRNEQVMTKLSNAFAALAIVVSCLGLLGLVMFSAEQRTREIGIRKALGATVANIVGLLSQDFVKIVALSFLVATPIAAYLMHQWLNGFAFKIDLSWWIFAFAGIVALCVALLTISFQAIQSARANPVDSLRSE
ncbi:ABC transporter permease [Chryseolinea sp. Jin1]|uniref:ABC transporter permease n=1 Tax=Chryseolinea lacunae TaxID=2801331 RepID=A0ABS1KMX7_9BACT|nr:ABC transporter permease [Chryseolinea lacunae]